MLNRGSLIHFYTQGVRSGIRVLGRGSYMGGRADKAVIWEGRVERKTNTLPYIGKEKRRQVAGQEDLKFIKSYNIRNGKEG